MFYLDGMKPIKTWNPFVGCKFDCTYCWARRMAKRLANCNLCRNFVPHEHPERLSRIPSSNIIFVVDMGDISFASQEYRNQIAEAIIKHQKERIWFFESKNPKSLQIIYQRLELIADNLIFSTTIETDNYEITRKISKAPDPFQRAKNLALFPVKKHVSIEPILPFNMQSLLKLIDLINPEIISVGLDNWNTGIPKPSIAEVEFLMDELQGKGYFVEDKSNIKGGLDG